MLTPIIDYCNAICAMPVELINDLWKYGEIKYYKKNDLILAAGTTSSHTLWILKGAVRSYYLKEGKR